MTLENTMLITLIVFALTVFGICLYIFYKVGKQEQDKQKSIDKHIGKMGC